MKTALKSMVRNQTLRQILILGGLMVVMLLAVQVFGVDTAFAQLISPEDQPEALAAATGGETSFRAIARTIVNFFLLFLGFIATVMIIYGGVLYVTSAGNQESIDKAKKILLYAVVGIVIILISFALVNTILGAATGDIGLT